ncbi:unnamed protein product, partial [Prorocentrum cordatum]
PSRPRRGSSVRSAPPRRGRWRSVGSLRSAVVAVPRRCAPSGLPCGLSSSPLRGRLGRFSFARAVAADAYGSSCFWPRPSFRVRRRRATLSHAGKAMPARARVSRVQSDILKYQRSSRLLLRKLPFQRMVRSISNDLDPGSSCKMNPVALQMLQKASEEYARRLFESANRCAMHAKRVTVFPKALRSVHGQRPAGLPPRGRRLGEAPPRTFTSLASSAAGSTLRGTRPRPAPSAAASGARRPCERSGGCSGLTGP